MTHVVYEAVRLVELFRFTKMQVNAKAQDPVGSVSHKKNVIEALGFKILKDVTSKTHTIWNSKIELK